MDWLKIKYRYCGLWKSVWSTNKKMPVSDMFGTRYLQSLICRGLLVYSCLSTVLSILADVSKIFVWQGIFSRLTLTVEVSLNIRCFLCSKNCRNKYMYSLLISLVKHLICFDLRLFYNIATSDVPQGALIIAESFKTFLYN